MTLTVMKIRSMIMVQVSFILLTETGYDIQTLSTGEQVFEDQKVPS